MEKFLPFNYMVLSKMDHRDLQDVLSGSLLLTELLLEESGLFLGVETYGDVFSLLFL